MEVTWSEHDFEKAAKELALVSETLDLRDSIAANWTFETSESGVCFLKRAPLQLQEDSLLHLTFTTADMSKEEEDLLDVIEEDPDLDLSHEASQGEVAEWRLSIVYSDTWRVPVLYFNVTKSNGSPYTRTDLIRYLMAKNQNLKNEVEDSWEFVSHEEHPISGSPSLFLHPCQSHKRLQAMGANSLNHSNRLWSWMSMVFPSLGFSISPKAYMLLQKSLTESL